MGAILERVESLIALASSSNQNEARNAAVLAVQLIRKHRLVISLPEPGSTFRGRARSEPEIPVQHARRNTPPESRRTPQPKRARSSKNVKRVVDPPEKIVAPLGGECIHCGARYRAETTIYWFAAGGGMHVKCFEEWARSTR